jgi:hypothetical protein
MKMLIADGRSDSLAAIVLGLGAWFLSSGDVCAQTTRTNSSAVSTNQTLPSSSSTSAASPCYSTTPTSPCYSAGTPRIRCYSAVNPNEPCESVTSVDVRPSSVPSPLATKKPPVSPQALTEDQARAQVEAQGYSNVSKLQKDSKGAWHGRAEKDGLRGEVTLDTKGNVTAY